MSKGALILLYLVVVLLPLGLSWRGSFPPRSFVDELASGSGMLAYTIILAEFLLSGRFRVISGKTGMDVTMRAHQLLARFALGLALVHPVLYQTPFIPPYPWDSTRQLSLSMDIAGIAAGLIAWLMLGLLVFFAIFRDQLDQRYETWRLTHGIGAAMIAGLLLYHTLTVGRYAQDPVLAVLWAGMVAVAVLSLAHIYLVKPLLKLRTPWVMEECQQVAKNTWEVVLAPRRHDGIHYKAGQFVWLSIGRRALSLNENPFSISSAPASGERLRFVIKELGDFTRSLGTIPTGTKAYVDGPHGSLVVSGRTEPGIALIAGGVGIAPILSILRQLQLEGDPRPTILVYGNRTEEQIVFRDELDGMARDHGTDITLALYEPPAGWEGYHGMCDADLLRQLIDTPQKRQWLYVLCGPPVMMKAVEANLTEIGVPKEQILSESFKYD